MKGRKGPGKVVAIAALCAAACLLLVGAFVAGDGVVGSLVETGDATLDGMSAGAAPADSSGERTNPFSNVADGHVASPGYDSGAMAPGAAAAPEYDYAGGIALGGTGDGGESYAHVPENGYVATAAQPLSTFAADVDTASYSNIRRKVLSGQPVDPDAVRVEEMLNYFRYDYPAPADGEPFSVTTEIADCPWNGDRKLLRIGMQAAEPDGLDSRPPCNLVFLVDVSGSMGTYDKLPLASRAFAMLAENLGPRDMVSIVTYAGADEVVLSGAEGTDQVKIREALEGLMAGGGTNGAAGIRTAYDLAERYFIEGGNNRVILATDGDLNMGVSDVGGLKELVSSEKESGVFLSVLGFGTGNLQDDKLEAMADAGDGHFVYVDSGMEARRALVEDMGGTLLAVAKDVKFQVEFNPDRVAGYRLVGYENRLMAAEDFADDSKDGGELGQGHRVTALYELDMAPGSRGDYAVVSVRYKEPDGTSSRLLEYPVDEGSVSRTATDDFKFMSCVAATGLLLKNSGYVHGVTYRDIYVVLSGLDLSDDPYKAEFREIAGILAGAGASYRPW